MKTSDFVGASAARDNAAYLNQHRHRRLRQLLRCPGWIAVLLLLCQQVAAEEGYTSRAEVLTYGSGYRVDRSSPFNPDNQLIRQPSSVWSAELRPDLSWANEEWRVQLKPRALLETSAETTQRDAWLNEGNVRWRPGEGISLTAGREVLLWGPAQFWNPSNPFFTDNGKANAKREVLGKTFARANWQFSEGWNLHAISQLDRGHSDSGKDRMDALKLDWVGNETSAALVLASEQARSLQWRGWAQWTVNDAWLLYGESAWARRQVRVAQTAPTPTGWQVVNGSADYALDATLGASYTFENGWTFNSEYYRHDAGLSAAEYANWNRLAVDARAQFAPNSLAASQLGAALNPQTSPLRRNYLGLQLRNGNDQKIGWNLRYSHGLDDHSGQVVGQISRDMSDRWQLWGTVMLQHGSHATEYGRWLDGMGMLGATGFLW